MSLPRYEGYRDSGIDWIGELPAGWSLVPLKYLVSLRSGGTPDKGRPEFWDGSVPWASSKDLKVEHLADTQDHLTQLALDVGAAATVPAGSVLVVVRGMILSRTFPVTVADVPMAINQDLKAIVPKRHVHDAYCAWLLRGSSGETLRRLDEAGHGTKALRMDAWTSMPVPLPPLDEQKRIAAFLQHETGKLDALIVEQQRLIDVLKEKRQAVVSHTIRRGLDPTIPLKSSDVAWLGAVPKHWELVRLANIFSEVSEQGNDELPVLSVSIHDGVSDRELEETEVERKVTRSEDRSKYKRVAPGDLVYNMMRAWQGGFGTVNVEGVVSPAYVVARPKRTLHTPFIEHLLRTPAAVEEIRRHSQGVTDFRLRLYWDEFKNIRIALPPLSESVAICEEIAAMDESFDRLTAEAQRAIGLLEERRSALISAAVTGKVDVRGAMHDGVAAA